MDLVTHAKASRLFFDWVRRSPLTYERLKRRLRALQSASLAERQAFTDWRLERMLAQARKGAYGRVHGARLLSRWPVLEKQAVRGKEDAFRCRPAWLGCKGQTSGTTGTPLTVFRSLKSLLVEQVCIDLVIEGQGFGARELRTAVLRGDNVKPPSDIQPPFWRSSEGGRSLILSSSHLRRETLDHFVAKIRDFSPDSLFCYPSSLHALCAMLELRGLHLNIPLVVTSSEVLDASTVSLARQVFACRFADFYGQAERVAFAASTEDGRYRFSPGYASIELRFNRIEDQEELYEIIGTNLWNAAMPLVRFRTGDLIAVPKGTTALQLEEISHGVRPFTRIHGRDDGIYIHGLGGTRLFGMPKIMNGVRNVYQSQIIQEAFDQVRIIIVPTVNFSDADREQILANARLKIPDSIRVHVTTGQRLETTHSGKSPFIIRRVEQ